MAHKAKEPSDPKTPPLKYLLGRPLPLTELSSLTLSADELTAIRKDRLAWIFELHRNELKRWRNQVRKAKQRALLIANHKSKASRVAGVQQQQRSVLNLAARYKQQETEASTWVPNYSCPDDRGGVTFDPVNFDLLGSELEGYLQHIPSWFSVEWAGEGALTETVSRLSRAPVHSESPARDQCVLVRQQVLNDAVFKEWILKVYETFCDWFPPTNSGRPSLVSRKSGRLSRRKGPELLTIEVVNHYVPGLKLTEGYLDELLKPIKYGKNQKRDLAQTAPDHIPDASTTTNTSRLHALFDEIVLKLQKKNRAREARRVTT